MYKMIMDSAIETYGKEHQIDKAIEEMSELIKALLKFRYAAEGYEMDILQDAVDEEMADVRIMMTQLTMIFDNAARQAAWKRKKLERLERKLAVERLKGGADE